MVILSFLSFLFSSTSWALTPAPSPSPGPWLGGGTCTVTNSSDLSGVITLNSLGTTSTIGNGCGITFLGVYSFPLNCVVTPADNFTAAMFGVLMPQVTVSTTFMKIKFAAASPQVATYSFIYVCSVGTNN